MGKKVEILKKKLFDEEQLIKLQRRENKIARKRQKIKKERLQLFEMKIDEEIEIKEETEKIKEKIKKIEAERKHNAMLMEWKIERAKLSKKRNEIVSELDQKYFAEFQKYVFAGQYIQSYL